MSKLFLRIFHRIPSPHPPRVNSAYSGRNHSSQCKERHFLDIQVTIKVSARRYGLYTLWSPLLSKHTTPQLFLKFPPHPLSELFNSTPFLPNGHWTDAVAYTGVQYEGGGAKSRRPSTFLEIPSPPTLRNLQFHSLFA